MKQKIKKIAQVLGVDIELRLIYFKTKENINRFCYPTIEKKEKYIKKIFFKKLGYTIDFNDNPETFNQKIQFRKLYDHNPLYTVCADKYKVREYVKEKIGEEYLIPLYLVTDNFTEQHWEELPNEFVAKANHNSGPVQVVKNKNRVNSNKVIKELNNQLKVDFGLYSLQPHYSAIPKKIIVEKFIGSKTKLPDDYKFHIFNGENSQKVYIEYITDRTIEAGGSYSNCVYDENWNKQNFNSNVKREIPKPKNLKKMLNLAKKLAEDFDYVRVDLYDVDNQIYFGELTFTDSNGFDVISNNGDKILGKAWEQRKFKEI